VYLGWANPVFLAFFAFNRINNLRIFSVGFSPIPTAPTSFLINITGLAKSARQQKAALRKGTTSAEVNFAARMASRRPTSNLATSVTE
jgi:hypothetical protein